MVPLYLRVGGSKFVGEQIQRVGKQIPNRFSYGEKHAGPGGAKDRHGRSTGMAQATGGSRSSRKKRERKTHGDISAHGRRKMKKGKFPQGFHSKARENGGAKRFRVRTRGGKDKASTKREPYVVREGRGSKRYKQKVRMQTKGNPTRKGE